jgi:P27 family predicted phage terminase small subunit
MVRKNDSSSFLCPETQVFKDNLIALLKSESILTNLDQDTLNLAVNAYDVYTEATRILRKDGLVVVSKTGNKSTHPAYKMQIENGKLLANLLDQFGMNPHARKELAKPKEKSKEESDIAKFLKDSKKKVNAEVQNN